METAGHNANEVRFLVTSFPVTLVRMSDGSVLGAISPDGLNTATDFLFRDGNSYTRIVYRPT